MRDHAVVAVELQQVHVPEAGFVVVLRLAVAAALGRGDPLAIERGGLKAAPLVGAISFQEREEELCRAETTASLPAFGVLQIDEAVTVVVLPSRSDQWWVWAECSCAIEACSARYLSGSASKAWRQWVEQK